MSLYGIVLADDEEEIREGIIKKINWESLGFSISGAAENGVEALEMCEHLHPDVVITDIKMPFMDGIELCKRVSEAMPSVKLIVFSGFDEFEYAKMAIKYNVAEYILKPVNSAELTETLKKLKLKLDREMDERRNIEKLRSHYERSLPVMREQFLVGLLEGRLPRNRINQQARLYLNASAKYWAVALLCADVSGRPENTLKGKEELIPIMFMRTADEILSRFCRFTSFPYSDWLVILADLESEKDMPGFIDGLNEVCKSAGRVLGVRVSAGVGSPSPSLSGMRHSYVEARNAIDYSAVMGDGRAIYINDVEPDMSVYVQFDEHDEREVMSAIKLGGEKDIAKQIDSLFARFETHTIPIGQYKLYAMEIATALLKTMRSYGLSADEVFGEDINCFNAIASFRSVTAMRKWLTEICVKISGIIKRERINSTKLLARNAKQYIEEHYSDPELSVEKLCSYLHVSPAYFSTVFKRETEMSFVSYLTEVRLQNALNLLNTTDDKTYIIASKVGYTEQNYFSYVFKRRFGVSPSKYRNK